MLKSVILISIIELTALQEKKRSSNAGDQLHSLHFDTTVFQSNSRDDEGHCAGRTGSTAEKDSNTLRLGQTIYCPFTRMWCSVASMPPPRSLICGTTFVHHRSYLHVLPVVSLS